MSVKIVTDSIADLPPGLVKDLDIKVVPIIVRFGDREFRDGIDLTPDQFYARLKDSAVPPVTSTPSPGVFAEVFDRLAETTDQILAIMVSAKLSGTCEVARQSVQLMRRRCRVEVLDSGWATMAQGFIVLKAVRAARSGMPIDQVMQICRDNIPRVGFLSTFDTLEYLRRGGRIGKAQAFLGSVLQINPLITLREGVVEPAGRVRSREKAVERLFQFAGSYSRVENLAVEDTACPDEAEGLANRLNKQFPGVPLYRSRMTPAIGAHTGPGLLLVAVEGDRS